MQRQIDTADVVELYLDGLSIRAIAAIYRVRYSRVARLLGAAGVVRGRQRPWKYLDKSKWDAYS